MGAHFDRTLAVEGETREVEGGGGMEAGREVARVTDDLNPGGGDDDAVSCKAPRRALLFLTDGVSVFTGERRASVRL